ncbi:MAG: ATP-binding cassette domain-containing protein [Kofleriaceae bacterium]
MIRATLDKTYPNCRVLRAATIDVAPGTVHALVGENGAGKSTLVKILAGILPADAGTFELDGRAVALDRWNRSAARRAGIGIVQQHGAFSGALTVVENAVLGAEPIANGLLSLEPTARALKQLGDKIGLAIDPWARVEDLPLGAAQRAEIVTALHFGAKILLLDEPTAVLAPIEVDGLLKTLRELAAGGTTIVIVTHKLDEVKTVADAVTVLRQGETVGTFGRNADTAAIARAMVGGELPEPSVLEPPPSSAPVVLELRNVATTGLSPVTLSVRAREIVGVAGVDGNGQRELALAIAGLIDHAGAVRVADRDVTRMTPKQRFGAGLAHVPEDRMHGGLVLDATIGENLTLGRDDVTGRFVIDRARTTAFATTQIKQLDIRPASTDAITRSLSGGNQQKIVIGRELTRPRLSAVIAAQPTRGVDIGGIARIHDQLRTAARNGAGVLVISADLDELLALCHRIVVMLRGAITGERADLAAVNVRAELGGLMTGGGA